MRVTNLPSSGGSVDELVAVVATVDKRMQLSGPVGEDSLAQESSREEIQKVIACPKSQSSALEAQALWTEARAVALPLAGCSGCLPKVL